MASFLWGFRIVVLGSRHVLHPRIFSLHLILMRCWSSPTQVITHHCNLSEVAASLISFIYSYYYAHLGSEGQSWQSGKAFSSHDCYTVVLYIISHIYSLSHVLSFQLWSFSTLVSCSVEILFHILLHFQCSILLLLIRCGWSFLLQVLHVCSSKLPSSLHI